MKKLITSILAAITVFTTYSCAFQYYAYEDYIYAINNREVHVSHIEANANSKTVTYTTINNMVVDFPISVSVKLVSNKKVILNGDVITDNPKPAIKSCALQYRVLPNGKWITVQKYETETGTIPSSYPPNYYLGRNNIYPRCNPGDIIMIRVYITDGIWQSGDANSLCADKLSNNINGTMTLPNTLTVTTSGSNKTENLGGYWSPNLVTTVIWSGKTRAIK